MFHVYGDNLTRITVPAANLKAAQRWAFKHGFVELFASTGEQYTDVMYNGKTWIQTA